MNFRISKTLSYPLLKLGMNVDKALLIQVKERVKKMLKLGFVSEVKSLLEEVNETWAPMLSVGYKEVVQFLKNDGIKKELDLEGMIVQSTMKLAKKQKTWFKRDKAIHWLGPNEFKAGRNWWKSFIYVRTSRELECLRH